MNRTKIGFCQACNAQTPFTTRNGLDGVIQTTFDALPAIAKEAFVAAQRTSFNRKDQRVRGIITDFYEEQNHTFTSHGLLGTMAKMLTRLSLLWEFRDHGHLYATHIAKDMMSSFSTRDKIFLLCHKNKHQKNRATAMGIIWNRCVRELAKIVLVEAAESVSENKIEEYWHLIMDDCFKDLNEREIDILDAKISAVGLDKTLDQELLQRPGSHPQLCLNALLGDHPRSHSLPNALSPWEDFFPDSTETSSETSPNVSPTMERKRKSHRKLRSRTKKKTSS